MIKRKYCREVLDRRFSVRDQLLSSSRFGKYAAEMTGTIGGSPNLGLDAPIAWRDAGVERLDRVLRLRLDHDFVRHAQSVPR